MHGRTLQKMLSIASPSLRMHTASTSCIAQRSLHASAASSLQRCTHPHLYQLSRLQDPRYASHRCTSPPSSPTRAPISHCRSFSSSPHRRARNEDPCECHHPSWPLLSGAEAIDYSGHLVKIKPFARHLLIETPLRGSFDWTPRDELGDASLSGALNDALAPTGSRRGAEAVAREQLGGRVLLNRYATKLQAATPSDVAYGSVKVFPEGLKVQVDSSRMSAEQAVDLLHAPDVHTKARALGAGVERLDRPEFFVCGHMARDTRCGKTAGVLHSAITKHLARRGIAAEVGFVDHIGGHKFAGNLLCYLPRQCEAGTEGAEGKRYGGVWYGRVHLDNVERVLDETLAGRVAEDLVRVRL